MVSNDTICGGGGEQEGSSLPSRDASPSNGPSWSWGWKSELPNSVSADGDGVTFYTLCLVSTAVTVSFLTC